MNTGISGVSKIVKVLSKDGRGITIAVHGAMSPSPVLKTVFPSLKAGLNLEKTLKESK